MKTLYHLPLTLPDHISNEDLISCYDLERYDILRLLDLLSTTTAQSHPVLIDELTLGRLWSALFGLYDDCVNQRFRADIHRLNLKKQYERLIEHHLFGDL